MGANMAPRPLRGNLGTLDGTHKVYRTPGLRAHTTGVVGWLTEPFFEIRLRRLLQAHKLIRHLSGSTSNMR